jgi:hypothetical protein
LQGRSSNVATCSRLLEKTPLPHFWTSLKSVLAFETPFKTGDDFAFIGVFINRPPNAFVVAKSHRATAVFYLKG